VCHTGLLTACEQDLDEKQLDALISQIYFWNKTLHVSDSSSVPSSGVFHCKHSNGVCHTGLLTACEQDLDEKQLDALISQIYFWNNTLHILDSSSVPSSGFFHCTHSNGICHTGLLTASCEKILMMGQRNCPKHVEYYSKNKFEKLVHLVGFITRIYHNSRSPECRIP